MKKQFRITSKYLIERSHFFSKSQLVLSLQDSCLHMQPLSSDREEKEGGVNKIDWDLIIQVQASDRNPKEFVISAVPESKRKQLGVNAVSKANAQQHVFSCKERNRLLTEVIHKLRVLNEEKPILIEKAYQQTDIYRDNSITMVTLKLNPTVLQVQLKEQENGRQRLGGKIGQKLGSNIRQRSQKDASKTEETKKRFGSSFDESEGDEDRNPNYLGNSELFQNNDDGDYDDYSDYESDSRSVTQGQIMTPYRGSMFGGAYLGEDSGFTGAQGDQIHGGFAPNSHFIYLCDIKRIICFQQSLIIVRSNREIEKFILRNEDVVQEFAAKIKKAFKDTYKADLVIVQKSMNDRVNLFEGIDFLLPPTEVIQSFEVNTHTWMDKIEGIEMKFDSKAIYEVDQSKQKVRKSAGLTDLQMIKVIDKSVGFNLVLLFKKEVEFLIQFSSTNDRDSFISLLLTLRSLQLPPQGYIDQLIFLHNSTPDFSQRIFGHDSLENQQYNLDYESLLFRKLSENISYKDSQKIISLIDEALLNTCFAYQLKLEQKNIRIILRDITNTIEQYLILEQTESQILENALKISQEDHIIDFLEYAKVQRPDLKLVSQRGYSAKNDKSDRIKQYELVLDKLTRYLNFFGKILQSRIVLTEILENDELVFLLIRLMISRNSSLSIQASIGLHAVIEHYSNQEGKLENLNKKLLFRGKQQLNQMNQGQLLDMNQVSLLSQSFIIQDLGDKMTFQQAFKEYLTFFGYLYEDFGIVKSLHIYALSNIIRSILITRKQTTGKEEIKIIADIVFEEDAEILKVLREEQRKSLKSELVIHKDDPLRNKPIFHIVDKLALLDQKYQSVRLHLSSLLNQCLGYYKKNESEVLKLSQQYLMTYSIQYVWQLLQICDSKIQDQSHVSIQLLSKLFYSSQEGIALLLRCFPKTLFDRVESYFDISRSNNWGDHEWEEFFMKVVQSNFDSATEQWNDQTRKELRDTLVHELDEFLNARKIHKEVINNSSKKELVLANHEFNREKRVISRSINLKWNFMEFGIRYQCLKQQHLVWKYYLNKLLVERNLQETQNPFFTEKIEKPVQFWQELKIRFMSTFDKQEQIIIIKCMCVLYRIHYEELKELKALPYFLKLFEQQQYEHCHFMLLQLIHVSLTVSKEYFIRNLKKFIKGGGLLTLMNSMKLIFKELQQSPKAVQESLGMSALTQNEGEAVEPKPSHNFMNYTSSRTNSRYFQRNSLYICTGILCLKVFDLIFDEMSAIDYIPLPSNREFLLRMQSLAILSQSLMVENLDLTRELTIFIQKHMNNHYSYFKLKNSGMIEYLILCLSSKHGDRALEILQKFQEVSFEYNSHLKIGLFNSNDLKMLQDDRENIIRLRKQSDNENSQSLKASNTVTVLGDQKKPTILAESIFLRFLPIPFIKYLYEEGTQKFLEIYKMQNYESPILIWNQKMRGILERSIQDHSQDFVETLREFANKQDFELKQSEALPIYNKKFKNIVKYPEIENEVRCGRYYLRVWVSQNKRDPAFFDIPQDEEEEFHKNLQIELRHCIYDENFEDKEKIIILFKACLLTLHKFKTKKTFSLDEIKRILIHTCKNQLVYDDTVKQMVYIGIKIIYQVVKTESQQFISNSVKQNSDSLKEALTKIGVEIIGEIFTLILKNSFSEEANALEESDLERELDRNYQDIKMERIEAKTLSLCIQSFNMILNTDILAFVDFPLQNRISLFKQVSRLLDISFELIPLFKDRQLTNNIHIYESKTYNNSSFTQMQINSPRNNNHHQNPKNKKNKRSKSKRKRSKSKNKQQQISQNQHQSWQLVNLTNNQSNYNPQIGQILAKPTQNQLIMELDKYNSGRQKKIRDRKKIHKKDPTLTYQNQSLLSIIKDNMDKHSIELIFDMTRSIFELTREITKNPVLHPELIASGMAWKALKYIYLQLKEQASEFSDLKISLKEATATLKNLISFAHQLANFGAESFAFKNLTKETEKEIMKNFWLCIKSIFGQKIQETLISQFIITNNELRFQDYEPRRFLQQFSVREENSPLLVWNDETRRELLVAINSQIENLHESFFNELIKFEYSVNKRELRVEDIFVRHFNNQTQYKPNDIEGFSQKLLDKLRDIVELKYVGDLDEENHQNCIELVKAMKILIINENLLIADQDKFDVYISTFCNLIQLRPELEAQKYAASINEEKEMIRGVAQYILEIILHISKSIGLHFDYLKTNNDFFKMLIRAFYQKESEVVDSQTLIQILQNMLSSREIDIDQFLIGTGLIMFILNNIFEKKLQNQNMKDRVELIRIILQTSHSTQNIYSKYIPFYFFVEIQQKQLHDPDTEKIIEFIKDFDAPEFENVFIIWNSQLKQESHQRIKFNCEQIVRSYEDSNFQINLDLKDLSNPKLENEIIVSDVILRIYNMNPSVFINIKLNTFILHLSQEIWKVSQEIFKIGQSYQHEEERLRRGDSNLILQNLSQTNPRFKVLCNQSLILLTSLLLSLEQLLFNDYNHNRLMASKKEDKNAETKLYKQIIEKTMDQTQLDSKVYQIISFWLQTQVFLGINIPVEIRLTFYQIVFLIIDVSDAVKVFKDNQSLMQFITDSINNTYQIACSEFGKSDLKKYRKTIEDAMVMLIAQKMLRKDSEPTPALITSSMQKFLKIFEREKKLRKLVEFILIIMGQDQQYRQSVLEQVKQYNNQNTLNKIDIKLIAEGRPDNSETTEAILKIWRGKPASASDARRHYNILECYHIEDKLDETNIPKIKLPLLSKKSAKQYHKEEIFFDDLRLQSVADLPLSSRGNLNSGSSKNIQYSKTEKTGSTKHSNFAAQPAITGNQGDAPFLIGESKTQKLGYNPILENLDKTIGGFDLEAIPRQDESFSDEDDLGQN